MRSFILAFTTKPTGLSTQLNPPSRPRKGYLQVPEASIFAPRWAGTTDRESVSHKRSGQFLPCVEANDPLVHLHNQRFDAASAVASLNYRCPNPSSQPNRAVQFNHVKPSLSAVGKSRESHCQRPSKMHLILPSKTLWSRNRTHGKSRQTIRSMDWNAGSVHRWHAVADVLLEIIAIRN